MPATPVKVGPFAGGLNNYSGPTSVGDNEATVLQNFDLDFDGSLVSRPPITVLGDFNNYPVVPGPIKPLNWFINSNGDRYLICSFVTTVTEDSVGQTWAYNEETGAWTVVSAAFAATVAVQYADKMWLVSNHASVNGGSWTPAGGFVSVAAMVKGRTAAIYKERLFVGAGTANINRVYFSNPADFTTWQTSINFFDAKSGDGENVTVIYTFQDAIVIFKSDSTYLYSYDSNPSRGSVRLINGAVGCSNKNSVVEYEGSLYVHYKTGVYQVSNWNFTLINLKVKFEYVVKFGSYQFYNEPSLSILNDRLVVKHYDNIYVFNLRMGVWSTWEISTVTTFSYFIPVPRKLGSEPLKYYGGCRRQGSGTSNHVLFEWRPDIDAARSEPMTCILVTKTYDFNVPYTFKRLFWWGADLLTKGDLTYRVSPQVYAPAVTHAQMGAFAHQDIVGTHLRPLDISIEVFGTIDVANSIGLRMFMKFVKSLRFRQIYFTVSGDTDGTTSQGPIRLYSISAFIDNKQQVPNQIS